MALSHLTLSEPVLFVPRDTRQKQLVLKKKDFISLQSWISAVLYQYQDVYISAEDTINSCTIKLNWDTISSYKNRKSI